MLHSWQDEYHMVANFFSPTQWVVVLVILFLLFGAKKLPEIARSVGKSLGEFKKARQEFEDELMKASAEEEKKAIATSESGVSKTEEKKENDHTSV